jgi:hypothetical protein
MAPLEEDSGIISEMGAQSRPQELGTKTERRFQELRGSDHSWVDYQSQGGQHTFHTWAKPHTSGCFGTGTFFFANFPIP